MEKVSFEELTAITGGTVLKTPVIPYITGAVIDSRAVTEGDLFIPIKGERVDGHQFIEKAADFGASVTLTERDDIVFPKDIGVVKVDSCLAAMKALAAYNRNRYTLPVIAVTGSSGKTTTKDLIAAVLSEKYNTLKTQGNFNNEYGIPQTLYGLTADHEAAVIEMGMDHLNDIAKSIHEVRPELSVITNIGTAHLEILKTQENILKAKCEIFETMGEGDIALLNGDDPWLNTIDEEQVPFKVSRVGIDGDHLDLKAEHILSGPSGITFEAGGTKWRFAYPGRHNVYNCLMGIFIGRHYGMTDALIQQGLDRFKPSGNRMEILSIDGYTVINDSYNANPDAMKAALSMLEDMAVDRRKIAVLGDMLEMGTMEKDGHLQIGKIAAEKADILIAAGNAARYYLEGAKEIMQADACYLTADAEAAGTCLKNLVQPGDMILVKASRGVHLEKVIEILKGNGEG